MENMEADDDSSVLAKDDRESFGRPYDRYYPRLHWFCHRRLARSEAADEVVAEAFLSIARGIAAFPGKTASNFRCWAYPIMAKRRTFMLGNKSDVGRFQGSTNRRRTIRRFAHPTPSNWLTSSGRSRKRWNGWTNGFASALRTPLFVFHSNSLERPA
jgi:hypothetical protein